MRRLAPGQELGGEEGQRELRGPSAVLPLLLPRQGCRKRQREQVTERASWCVGHAQGVWESRCSAQLFTGMPDWPCPGPSRPKQGTRRLHLCGDRGPSRTSGQAESKAFFFAQLRDGGSLPVSHLGCLRGRAGAELAKAEPQAHIGRLVQGDPLQGTCSACLTGVSGSRLTVLGRFPSSWC